MGQTCHNATRLTTTDSPNVRFAITTSVLVHVVIMLLLAWIMGMGASARMMIRQQLAAKEEPKVAMIFPSQLVPVPKVKPKLNTKQYIRTTQNAPETAKPTKSDFVSDRNTKAASNTAPFPDGDKPMPSSRGESVPTMELVNRELHQGKTGDDKGAAPAAAPSPPPPPPPVAATPKLEPKPPSDPITLPPASPAPKQLAKAQPPDMNKLLEDLDKSASRMDVTKLPIQVKKADIPPPASATPPAAAPPPATVAKVQPAKPAMHTMEDFSPLTRKAAVKGTISNKGEAAVDAEATPMGQFMRRVTAAVEKKWHELQLKNAAAVSYGYLRVRFYVNRAGHVEQPEFLEKSSNPLMDDFTLDAILAADLPPIPNDLLPLLEEERIPVEYSIIIND